MFCCSGLRFRPHRNRILGKIYRDLFGGGRMLLLAEPRLSPPYPLARTFAPPPHFRPHRNRIWEDKCLICERRIESCFWCAKSGARGITPGKSPLKKRITLGKSPLALASGVKGVI